MWQAIMQHIPSLDVWIGAAASLVIPLCFTWLIKIIREWGNPPWLQKQTSADSGQQQSSGSSQQQPQQETSDTPQQSAQSNTQ